jgi:hypothetical protein
MSVMCQISAYPAAVAGAEARGQPKPHPPATPSFVWRDEQSAINCSCRPGKTRAKIGFPSMATGTILLKDGTTTGGKFEGR